MTPLYDVLGAPAVDALGRTLIRFTLHGTIIALVVSAALWLLRRRSPEVRHAVACIGLLVMATAPIVTYVAELGTLDPPRTAGSIAPSADGGGAASPATTGATSERGSASLSILGRSGAGERPAGGGHALVVGLWLVGVLALSTRMGVGARRVRTVTHDRSLPVDVATRSQFERLRIEMGIGRAVRLVTSTRNAGAMTAGWLRPVVVLPVTAVTGLDAHQLRAVLAHELAHVRRYDYVVQIATSIVTTLLFYHPGVWWLASVIERERELCCDDMAVRVTGDRKRYASALLALAELRPESALALGATRGPLLHRVRRVLGFSSTGPRRHDAAVVALALLVAVALTPLVMTTSADPSDRSRDDRERVSDGADVTEAADADDARRTFEDWTPIDRDRLQRGPRRHRRDDDRVMIEFESGRWDLGLELDGDVYLGDGRIDDVEIAAGSFLGLEERDAAGVRRRVLAEGTRDGILWRFEVRPRRARGWSHVERSRQTDRWLEQFIAPLVATRFDADVRALRVYREQGMDAVSSYLNGVTSDGLMATAIISIVEDGSPSPSDVEALVMIARARIESDGTLSHLLSQLHDLDAISTEAAAGAAREVIESDGTLSAFLVQLADTSDDLEADRPTIVGALESIESDGTLAATLITLVDRGVLSPGEALRLASDQIESDSTLAHVIDTIGRESADDDQTRAAVLAAVNEVESDGTLAHLVLTLSRDGVISVMDALEIADDEIGSSGTLEHVLAELAPSVRGDREAEEAWHRIVESMSSRASRRLRDLMR